MNDRKKSNKEPLSIVLYPKAVHARELGSHFEDTNYLKGTDSQTREKNSEEKCKYNISQEAKYI